MAGVVYHWKHGWIPLDHTAALAKAHGNHDQAIRMLAAAKDGHTGIHTAEHLKGAKADLPNLPSSHRPTAERQIVEASRTAAHVGPGTHIRHKNGWTGTLHHYGEKTGAAYVTPDPEHRKRFYGGGNVKVENPADLTVAPRAATARNGTAAVKRSPAVRARKNGGTEAQIDYARSLIRANWHDSDLGQFGPPPTAAALRKMSKRDLSELINEMKYR